MIRSISPLIKYDKSTGQLTAYDPEPNAATFAEAMLVEKEAVWMVSRARLLRFDRAAETWETLTPPLLPARKIFGYGGEIIRSGSNLWFIAYGSYLRYTPPIAN